MTPFTERQSVIRQLLGGEGLAGKLGPSFNPLEGANPRLEEERFARRAQRFDDINARNAAIMANSRGPVHWTQTLSGIGSGIGSQVMSGASERAGGARQKMLEELLASGQMTPDVLARISALDPEYGAQLSADQRDFEQQQMLAEQDRAFTLQRDEAQRQHEMQVAAMAPEERTAMEQQLIAAGYDPNGPVGEDGLNDFQRAMREQLSKEGGGGQPQFSVTLDENGRQVITYGTPPGGAPGSTAPAPTPVAGQDTSGLSFGELGKIEPGMIRGVGPDNQIIEAPIPGSNADLERQAAEAAGANSERQKIRAGSDILDAIDQVEGMINWKSTGFIGKLTRDLGIGGTPGADIEIALRPIVANMGFDALQQMRAASETGAALGQVTERENTLLQSQIKSLDPNGSPELLKENLAYVKEMYDVIINTDPNDPASVARYEAVMGYPLDERAANIAAGTPGGATAPAAAATPAPSTGGTVQLDGETYEVGKVYQDENGKFKVNADGTIVDVP
jgi:hypothetical protein